MKRRWLVVPLAAALVFGPAARLAAQNGDDQGGDSSMSEDNPDTGPGSGDTPDTRGPATTPPASEDGGNGDAPDGAPAGGGADSGDGGGAMSSGDGAAPGDESGGKDGADQDSGGKGDILPPGETPSVNIKVVNPEGDKPVEPEVSVTPPAPPKKKTKAKSAPAKAAKGKSKKAAPAIVKGAPKKELVPPPPPAPPPPAVPLSPVEPWNP